MWKNDVYIVYRKKRDMFGFKAIVSSLNGRGHKLAHDNGDFFLKLIIMRGSRKM